MDGVTIRTAHDHPRGGVAHPTWAGLRPGD